MEHTYKNPVIFADYSDPDVIRVGDTYFMTASSFHFTPGLPLLVSHDLVHWNLAGYAAKEIPLQKYAAPRHSKGIWAPSLRFHDGRFIITVAFPDEGVFVCESADFFGEWTPLRCVKKARGFIDPCPLWLENGKAYIVHAYAKSRIGFKSRLGIFEVNPRTLECIGDDRFIFIGDETQPTIEGPKIYKRGAFFYILAPAGGVKDGWQTVLRSFSLFGPYTEHIALSQGSSHINGPHQGALVESANGDWHFVHFQDRGVYGRVILTERAKWTENGLLLLGTGVDTGAETGEPEDEARATEVLSTAELRGISAVAASDDFAHGGLGLQWQWQANAVDADFVRRSENGIELKARHGGKVLWDIPNVVSEKIVYENFTAEIEMDFSHLQSGERAGALFLGGQYATAEVRNAGVGGFQLCFSQSATDSFDSERRTEKTVAVLPLSSDVTSIVFRLRFTSLPPNKEHVTLRTADSKCPSDAVCSLSATVGGTEFKSELPPFFCSGEQWTGGRIGFFAQGENGSVIVRRVSVTPFVADWQKETLSND